MLNGRAFKLLASATLTATLALSVSAQANMQQAEAVPGEYIVRLKPSIKEMSAAQVARSLGAHVKSTIPSQNIVVVKRATFETADSAVKTMAQNPMVDVVEPNFIYRINKTSNDPMMEQLWGLKNYGQKDPKGQVGVAGIDIGNIEQAWDITTGDPNMVIAVIDTGVDFNHPDLKDNLWVNVAEANGQPGIDDDNNGVVDDIHGYNSINNSGNATDDQGHGSHCAGTIGARGDNGVGIVGVVWQAKIMSVKFLDKNGSGTLENALKSIDYATKMGAKVMSNSWGGGGFSQTLLDAIKRSNEAGAIFIAAAGNSNQDNDARPAYPATYDVPNIISVAAIDNKGAKASFSSYGKRTVHIGAPGVNVWSTTGGTYQSFSGTSMATPHVSGVAALVWGHEPNLTALELKQRLLATATPIAGLKNRVRTNGMVNAYAALTNTVPPPDVNDPANWSSVAASYASASPYAKNTNETYEVHVEGATQFALYFEKFDTEANYDTLQLVAADGTIIQTLSGNNDDVFSAPVTGNYVKLVFKSDASVEKTGWRITKIAIR